ncbi:hypothetical protein Cs7R123_31620 [Catellatospora sp. TT07R-123]|uniref:hypothetical protein n=1 Tax=Catellatospora sp. TT07R-123 TaxID=2733863 RepID=UPI001AFE1412|nr:hypothetical protein [Catellatospora sp. TT07R-123]GHJ45820.1 hypothetical protein Cs7R123_31620 [Catellatospora sp. TT07R-123]
MVVPLAMSLLALLPVAEAAAAPGGGDGRSTGGIPAATWTVMRRQEALQPVVDRLYREIDGAPGGFVSLAFEGDGVSVYWKGELTPGMARAVAEARSLGRVRVRPAPYSKRELEAAAAEIEAAATAAGADLQEISVRYDGTGLDVVRMDGVTAARVRARSASPAPARTSIDGLISELGLSVPVRVTAGRGPLRLASCDVVCSRLDDTAPWNGGTRIRIPGTAKGTLGCTSGFGVLKGGQSYLLTASHCMNPTNVAYDYANERIGGVYADNWDHDITMINARGSAMIFDGPAATSNTKVVRSSGGVVVNELLCQSGSTSGVLCGLKTQAGSYTAYGCDSDDDCFSMHDLSRAAQVDGLQSCREGDSGGPVYSLDGSGVRVKGTVTAYSVTDSSLLYYQDWTTIASDFGVTAKTN